MDATPILLRFDGGTLTVAGGDPERRAALPGCRRTSILFATCLVGNIYAGGLRACKELPPESDTACLAPSIVRRS